LSKAKKESVLPDRSTRRAQGSKKEKDFSKFLDMFALADFAIALLILLVGLGLHLLSKNSSLGNLIYTRAVLETFFFFLTLAVTAYGVSRFIHDYPAIQQKYFRQWFGAMIVVIVFVILTLGLPY
jgi:uncharacterized membrane protein YidH (DUF202 family)